MPNLVDILAFGAHPDDVVACAGGTLIKSQRQGYKVGILDLTSGGNSETAGSQTRLDESKISAKTMSVRYLGNLHLPERKLTSIENENIIVKEIRKYKPKIAIIPHWHDRHKSHRDASQLLERAIQTAKYSKILPKLKPHKVKVVLYYMIHYEFDPAFIFDISKVHDKKMKSLYKHKSQFFHKKSKGVYTKKLLDPDFIEAWIARSRWYGYISGFKYGEAFDMRRSPGLDNLSCLKNLYR